MFEIESKQLETASGQRYLCLIVRGELLIANMVRFKEVLMDAFREHQHVVLEMSQVTDIGLSAMQLFCSANKYAQRNGKSFELKNACSDQFLDRAKSFGFLRDRACNEAEDPLKCLWIPDNLS